MIKIFPRLVRGLTVLGFGSILLISAQTAHASSITDQTRIEEGIHVMGQDISGKTVAEAREIMEEQMESIAASTLTVTFGDETASIRMEDLDLSWDIDAALEEAADFGKNGSLISRYKEQTDLRYNTAQVTIPYTYSRSAILDFVTDDVVALDRAPVDASITRENGEFIITSEKSGLATDLLKTVDAICEMLDTSLTENMTVDSVTTVTEAEITADTLSTIRDRLATYSTDYSSSSYNRKTNIRVAAERIDGTILLPGESLSVDQIILERNEENGYLMAPQYTNGVTEDSYGGGVCQISTTLYNAVLRAELQIDERYPHSMVVHYVPYASDAAIAEGNKDFVFTNDTESPIYIAAYADGETLTFGIYGQETRPENRTIEFISETLEEYTPEPVTVYTDEQITGYESVSGTTSPVVSATLTKVVYIDGEEVSRTLLHTDHYSGRSKTILIGTGEPESETEETSSSDESTDTSSDSENWYDEEDMIDPPEPDDE